MLNLTEQDAEFILDCIQKCWESKQFDSPQLGAAALMVQQKIQKALLDVGANGNAQPQAKQPAAQPPRDNPNPDGPAIPENSPSLRNA